MNNSNEILYNKNNIKIFPIGKSEDLSGCKFNHLTALYKGENTKGGASRWWCECDCGNPNLILTRTSYLKNNHTKSCGKCIQVENLIGKTFGNWKVLYRGDDYISPKGEKCVQWVCECQCENKTTNTIRADILKSGSSKSCGCLHYLKYDLSGEYGIGWTNNGEQFYFDLEDYDLIKDYCWYFKKSNNELSYLIANVTDGDNKTIISFHRLVMNVCDPNIDIDHIKHNTFDNRKSQLRIANASLNAMNSKLSLNNTSGTTGIWYNKKNNNWCVEIMINRTKHYIGSYANKEDAINARKEAEEKYFGEWSYDNSQNMLTD